MSISLAVDFIVVARNSSLLASSLRGWAVPLRTLSRGTGRPTAPADPPAARSPRRRGRRRRAAAQCANGAVPAARRSPP
eukprot:5280628-Heterocapsa_arctica.AAC.1